MTARLEKSLAAAVEADTHDHRITQQGIYMLGRTRVMSMLDGSCAVIYLHSVSAPVHNKRQTGRFARAYPT